MWLRSDFGRGVALRMVLTILRCTPTSNGWTTRYAKSKDSWLPDSLHSIDTLHVAYHIIQQLGAAQRFSIHFEQPAVMNRSQLTMAVPFQCNPSGRP